MLTDKTADLDRLVGYLTPNLTKQRALLSNLLHPLTSKEEIEKRRQIISSFSDSPTLLNEFVSLIKDAERALADYETAKKHIGSNPLLRIGELCVSALALFGATRHASELSLHEDLKKRLSEISRQTEIVSSYLLSFVDNNPPAFSIKASDDGRIKYASFDITEYEQDYVSLQNKRKSFFINQANKKTNNPSHVLIVPELAESAYNNLERSLDSLVFGIGNEMRNLARELDFYAAALDYYAFLKERKIPYCFPEFGNHTRIEGLYDLLIVATKRNAVPNRFVINGNNGALIIGPNGSGKTVLWRSVLTAVLLNQSGLPVPAKLATLPIFKGVFSQMSSSMSRDGFGTFEEEVRILSGIVESASQDSAVFLNEIFQTTFFEEGARALTAILNDLSRRGVFCVVVTHLPINANELNYESVEMNKCYF